MLKKLRSLINVQTTPSGIVDVSLKACNNQPWGWEWGVEDPLARRVPWLRVRVGKLVIFSIEFWRWGFELAFMGFWWVDGLDY